MNKLRGNTIIIKSFDSKFRSINVKPPSVSIIFPSYSVWFEVSQPCLNRVCLLPGVFWLLAAPTDTGADEEVGAEWWSWLEEDEVEDDEEEEEEGGEGGEGQCWWWRKWLSSSPPRVHSQSAPGQRRTDAPLGCEVSQCLQTCQQTNSVYGICI